uniref:Uncharacterized protein n=1 Tax=Meloidogyne enterolobii TaxID=390850 RepID=A0A6V7UJK6_MELEN|nr:unnamed protein product [Meloidogyne enterolobii]
MLNIQGSFQLPQLIPILLNNSTIFQPAHSIRYFKTPLQAPTKSSPIFKSNKEQHKDKS